jgi:hypothetical protein
VHLANVKEYSGKEQNHKIEDDLLKNDFQLYQAFTLLKGWNVFQHHAKPLSPLAKKAGASE